MESIGPQCTHSLRHTHTYSTHADIDGFVCPGNADHGQHIGGYLAQRWTHRLCVENKAPQQRTTIVLIAMKETMFSVAICFFIMQRTPTTTVVCLLIIQRNANQHDPIGSTTHSHTSYSISDLRHLRGAWIAARFLPAQRC